MNEGSLTLMLLALSLLSVYWGCHPVLITPVTSGSVSGWVLYYILGWGPPVCQFLLIGSLVSRIIV